VERWIFNNCLSTGRDLQFLPCGQNSYYYFAGGDIPPPWEIQLRFKTSVQVVQIMSKNHQNNYLNGNIGDGMYTACLFSLSRMYGKAVWLYLLFHQLWLSMEHCMQGSIEAPGWGSVNRSQFTHHPSRLQLHLTRIERWILYNGGVILSLIHWLGPPLFLPWHSEAMVAIWS